MPKIFYTIISLIRLDQPAAYLLVFFPASFGLFLAYEKTDDLWYIPLFFIGAILARSAGCVINDFMDRDFDKQVQRTKNRPLANNSISNSLALAILTILLSAAFGLLLLLNVMSIMIGIICFCMIILYPMMKRVTYFPQAFLGITFNLGCLVGYVAVKDKLSFEALLMYAACGFWTFGYDSVYAFMDVKDDKIIGVRSSAVFLEHKAYKLYITIAYIIFSLFFVIANLLSNNYVGMLGGLLVVPILMWQVATLDISVPSNCLAKFRSNIYVGFSMSLSMLIGCLTK